MWIEVHHELPKHKKTLRFKTALKLKTAQAVGHLVMLWLHCIENAPDGDITDIPPDDLALFSGYFGKGKAFVDALLISGYADQMEDGRIVLHDWYDYAGKLLDKRQKDADRKRENRRTVRRTSCGQSTETGVDGPRDGAGNRNLNLNHNQESILSSSEERKEKKKGDDASDVEKSVENDPDEYLPGRYWSIAPGH